MTCDGHGLANLVETSVPEFADDDADALGCLGDHIAPRVDEDALSEGLATLWVQTPLTGSGHPNLLLDGARSKE